MSQSKVIHSANALHVFDLEAKPKHESTEIMLLDKMSVGYYNLHIPIIKQYMCVCLYMDYTYTNTHTHIYILNTRL